MRTPFVAGLALLVSLSTAATLHASNPQIEALEKRVSLLEARLDRILQLLSDHPALPDLKDEALRISAEASEPGATEPAGLNGAPQQVEAVVTSGPADDAAQEIVNVPYSGYMELHANNDGLNPTTLDFHRFVLLFGHGFGDRIRFWSELEFEHAFVEGGEGSGELELEQAYLDFLIDPRLNFRTGMILAPVGIINERHEPPSFNGVERPFVDTAIIPTTWFGSGAGLVGDLGHGLSYRSYLMSSLDAAEFSTEEGFSEGRQKGFFENARNLAWTGRLEYRGLPGLTLGMSAWTGETGFNLRDINGRATVFEFDGRYRWQRFQARGQFAQTWLGDAAQINVARRRTSGVNPNLAEQMRGFYLEAGASLFPTGFKHDLVGFYRYENFDTQYRMPDGFLPLKQFDRSAHVLGVTYFPFPDIALKFDYNFMNNQSRIVKALNRWNIGVGWWF